MKSYRKERVKSKLFNEKYVLNIVCLAESDQIIIEIEKLVARKANNIQPNWKRACTA